MEREEVKGPSPGYPKLSILEQWCLRPEMHLHLWLPSCTARLVSPGFVPPDQCVTPLLGSCIHHPISSATVLQRIMPLWIRQVTNLPKVTELVRAGLAP